MRVCVCEYIKSFTEFVQPFQQYLDLGDVVPRVALTIMFGFQQLHLCDQLLRRRVCQDVAFSNSQRRARELVVLNGTKSPRIGEASSLIHRDI